MPQRDRRCGDSHLSEMLSLTGNIRPEHSLDKLTGKTKKKVNKWTSELLDNEAIIGNIGLPPVWRTLDRWGRKALARRFKCREQGRRSRRSSVVRPSS